MRLRRQGVVLVLTFILAVPWIAAAESRLGRSNRAEPGISEVYEFLSRTWNHLESLWGMTVEGGARSRPDPFGPLQPTTDEGPFIDPLG